MANYLIKPNAKNNQDPTPGSPMFELSVGPTLLYLLIFRRGSCAVTETVPFCNGFNFPNSECGDPMSSQSAMNSSGIFSATGSNPLLILMSDDGLKT
ncbi:hypothetical protein PoB_000245500 [Plakobranchus ocellatus]|uniref:Uncharacterized protein n=1 Tax=Plakobranchus ocellatus TaxID=259542 RepID=A0AAV3XYP7_9GAST|nr:hypothetical protein PoB_000245500 [Plakobranchus ocellatus]